MILTDKGELWNSIATNCHYDDQKPLEAYSKLMEEVSKAPVIEAIPIEWLEHTAVQYVTATDRKFDSRYMAFIYTLISDWREENN